MSTFAGSSTDLFNAGEYVSEFEADSESSSIVGEEIDAVHSSSRKRRMQDEIFKKPSLPKVALPARTEYVQLRSEDEWHHQRLQFLSMDAYSRHKKMVNDYLNFYGGSMKDFERDKSTDRTDLDVVRDHNRFLWNDGEELGSWERRIARKYWDKLFKEYGIADLSRYRENRIGLRWRGQAEVVAGKGQFECGARKCNQRNGLRSWEMNFAYEELGIRKNALVKVRLCAECSNKLNYHSQKREVKRRKMLKECEEKEKSKCKTFDDSSSSNDSNDSESSASDEETKSSSQTKDKAAALGEPDNPPPTQVWKQPVHALDHPKSKEDEFEQYFEDMFL